MKRILTKKVIIGIVALGVVAVTVGVLGTRAVRSQPTDVSWLHDYALKTAQSMGEANPTMQYALTDGAGALAAVGRAGGTPADPKTPVYLVVLQGDFTYEQAFGHYGSPAPTGTTLVLEVDASTHGSVSVFLTKDPSRVDTKAIEPMSTFSE